MEARELKELQLKLDSALIGLNQAIQRSAIREFTALPSSSAAPTPVTRHQVDVASPQAGKEAVESGSHPAVAPSPVSTTHATSRSRSTHDDEVPNAQRPPILFRALVQLKARLLQAFRSLFRSA